MWEKTAWWNLQRIINRGATVNLLKNQEKFVAQIDEQKITRENDSLQMALLEAVIEYDCRNGMEQSIYHTRGPNPELAKDCWVSLEKLVTQGHWIWINPSRDRKSVHLDVRRVLSAPSLEEALGLFENPTMGKTDEG